jgi:hypothetical protein
MDRSTVLLHRRKLVSTKSSEQSPWASGPGEILRHGLELLKKDSDRNRRLSMISIDNAVELMMKTYLGLPKRITKLTLTRKQYEEASDSFPRLLEAMESFASDRLVGVDLSNLEWFHRLRNLLYHEGNGLTVERDKVEVYAALAQVLFSNLFGFPVPDVYETEDDHSKRLYQFLNAWNLLEQTLQSRVVSSGKGKSHASLRTMHNWQLLSRYGDLKLNDVRRLEVYRKVRNALVHGDLKHLKEAPTEELKAFLEELWSRWAIDSDNLPGHWSIRDYSKNLS